MQWVWDQTHRFRMRPDYGAEELDRQFETRVSAFLEREYGEATFPIRTSDLHRLLEKDAGLVDLRTDFGDERGEVEALVEFRRGRKPVVRITPRLSQERNLDNELRVALGHAYGHIVLHDFVFQSEEGAWLSLFGQLPEPPLTIHRCRTNSLMPLGDEDWMEWQAGYACGALLIPFSPLVALVRQFRHSRDLDHAALSDRSLDGATLVREVAERFGTSWNTAWARLVQLRLLSTTDSKSLF